MGLPDAAAREGLQAFPWLTMPNALCPNAVVALAERPVSGGIGAGLPRWPGRKRTDRVSEERDLVEDLDSLSFPDRDSIPSDLFRFPHRDPLTMISPSRGCPPASTAPRRRTWAACGGARPGAPWPDPSASGVGIRHFIFWGEISVAAPALVELCGGLVGEGRHLLDGRRPGISG